MAISGLQVIDIGLQNESTGSDSLYLAFNKTKNNFAILANTASPYNTFTGNGVSITSDPETETVNIDNTGVTSIEITSASLTVVDGTVTTTGTITVDLPANVAVTGQLLLNGSENLTTGSSVNLAVTASYFSTSVASTATLGVGTTGQIKTFMMLADGGDMVITVTNAGWQSSGTGTITFDNIGDGCTLQYITSKWFCIGNNGAIFA
jgi:phage baseplate assembly protein gpV